MLIQKYGEHNQIKITYPNFNITFSNKFKLKTDIFRITNKTKLNLFKSKQKKRTSTVVFSIAFYYDFEKRIKVKKE